MLPPGCGEVNAAGLGKSALYPDNAGNISDLYKKNLIFAKLVFAEGDAWCRCALYQKTIIFLVIILDAITQHMLRTHKEK